MARVVPRGLIQYAAMVRLCLLFSRHSLGIAGFLRFLGQILKRIGCSSFLVGFFEAVNNADLPEGQKDDARGARVGLRWFASYDFALGVRS